MQCLLCFQPTQNQGFVLSCKHWFCDNCIGKASQIQKQQVQQGSENELQMAIQLRDDSILCPLDLCKKQSELNENQVEIIRQIVPQLQQRNVSLHIKENIPSESESTSEEENVENQIYIECLNNLKLKEQNNQYELQVQEQDKIINQQSQKVQQLQNILNELQQKQNNMNQVIQSNQHLQEQNNQLLKELNQKTSNIAAQQEQLKQLNERNEKSNQENINQGQEIKQLKKENQQIQQQLNQLNQKQNQEIKQQQVYIQNMNLKIEEQDKQLEESYNLQSELQNLLYNQQMENKRNVEANQNQQIGNKEIKQQPQKIVQQQE